jgi:hypothetical protein
MEDEALKAAEKAAEKAVEDATKALKASTNGSV